MTRTAAPRSSLRRAINDAAALLSAAGIESAQHDAEAIAAHLAGTDRGRLPLIDPPDAGFYARYDEAVTARARRVPLQHLTGTAAFGPVTLRVGPGVFVPRPETEALLAWATAQPVPPRPVVVDVCTGSGALALALARHFPAARVLGIDDCPQALDYARHNCADSPVELVQADVTTAGLLPDLDGQVDLVVANPPYIPDDAVLAPEVARHDPHHALFGGPDGMAVIAAVAAHAARWLRSGGRVGVEHDDTTAEQTVALLRATGDFAEITAHRDLTGRPRFVTAERRRRHGE
ncbi:peptide chain release factor N(5)-glutamine methyltransferase [Mycobacterium sp. 1274756.6]|uniref:peptide chain release factor N(5)-glutamine methyltransferase n=1 Tax=Mycobacterium sp. 1274756.6 TaxID=1834076 RepID=UPI0007FD7C3B|nr:peptide chain release factor N(5)-glutamine methyltransferase [Mycobacterium sp. 1274756.6]OBJ72136.1 protein-(glutamine-N5) methyltransferase, release factor-specific [Mycobacterium sp. 1274756.6]